MNKQRLMELIAKFASRRIAVLGDFFLDKYFDFDSELAEISLETGKIANQVVGVRHYPGAAGTVICNLTALEAGTIIPVGFAGDDGEGYELRQDLAKMGCDMEHLLEVSERHTPVYLKPRNVQIKGLEGENERYDIKNRKPLPVDVEDQIISALRSVVQRADAIIIMSQVEEEGCGTVTARVRESLTELAGEYPDVIFLADSRRGIGEFRNVIIKSNQFEAVKAAYPNFDGNLDDDTVSRAGLVLSERTTKPVFVTRAEEGILVFDGESRDMVRGVQIHGPIDPTGAGDSVTAAAVMALTSGSTLIEAALVANLVGSITVQQIGVTGTASPEQLLERFALWESQG